MKVRNALFLTVFAMFLSGCAIFSETVEKQELKLNMIAAVTVYKQIVFIGEENGRILKSSDNGKNWQVMTQLPSPVRALIINMKKPDIIYAGLWNTSIYKSEDGGETWSHLKSFGNLGFRDLDLLNETVLICLLGRNGEIFKSQDEGTSWNKVVDLNLPNVSASSEEEWWGCLAIHPNEPNTWFGSMHKGERSDRNNLIVKSIDAGKTFKVISDHTFPDNENCWEITINPDNPDIILAATEGNGVLISKDGGKSWILSNRGLKSLHIYDISIDPFNSNIIYAGSRYFGGKEGGLFRSKDGGKNWEKVGF